MRKTIVVASVGALGILLAGSGCRSQDCAAMQAQWQDMVASPAMRACVVTNDCMGVGGQPLSDPCTGHSSIGGCGQAVNAKAYQASAGPRLESEFPSSCPESRASDCGPVFGECVAGVCVARIPGCFFRKLDASADLPFTPLDSDAM